MSLGQCLTLLWMTTGSTSSDISISSTLNRLVSGSCHKRFCFYLRWLHDFSKVGQKHCTLFLRFDSSSDQCFMTFELIQYKNEIILWVQSFWKQRFLLSLEASHLSLIQFKNADKCLMSQHGSRYYHLLALLESQHSTGLIGVELKMSDALESIKIDYGLL